MGLSDFPVPLLPIPRVQVRIVRLEIKPGSGDYEDGPEDREDQPGPWFAIEYPPAGSVRFSNTIGYFKTLEEAIDFTEKTFSEIVWD